MVEVAKAGVATLVVETVSRVEEGKVLGSVLPYANGGQLFVWNFCGSENPEIYE